jgi:hypothetical protein
LLVKVPVAVLDQETFEYLLPLAYQWARNIENFVLQHGSPLPRRQVTYARQVGVKDICRVRVLAVDRMPLPEEPALAEASRRTQIITDSCRAIAIGHAVVLRADAWGDRELFLHQLVHVSPNANGAADWNNGSGIIWLIVRTARISQLAHSKKKRVASRAKSAPPRLRRNHFS